MQLNVVLIVYICILFYYILKNDCFMNYYTCLVYLIIVAQII
jgi:hypothetical protein